jgi:hypothetical protein
MYVGMDLQDADGWRLGGRVGYWCAVARVAEDLVRDCRRHSGKRCRC